MRQQREAKSMHDPLTEREDFDDGDGKRFATSSWR